MVHPALVTAGATALIGSAVAFELTIFKPWREENWPDGIQAGIQRELRRTREDLREAALDIKDLVGGKAPRSVMPNQRDNQDRSRRNHRIPQRSESESEDDYGSDEHFGRNKVASTLSGENEFEMHENETARQRERLREMFDDISGSEMRNRKRDPSSKPSNTVGSSSSSLSQAQLQPQSHFHYFEPESPHHEIGSSSPTLSSRSEAGLAEPADPSSAYQRSPNYGASIGNGQNTTLFDIEDEQDFHLTASVNSNVGNLARSSSEDEDSDLDLVSPPETLANGWEQESNFSFPKSATNSNGGSRDVSVDGLDEDPAPVPSSSSNSSSAGRNGNNPFEEAWIVDEEEEEEDRKARAQLSQSQSRSQATLRPISDNHSESGESWADLEEIDRSNAVNTQGLSDSWSGSRSGLL